MIFFPQKIFFKVSLILTKFQRTSLQRRLSGCFLYKYSLFKTFLYTEVLSMSFRESSLCRRLSCDFLCIEDLFEVSLLQKNFHRTSLQRRLSGGFLYKISLFKTFLYRRFSWCTYDDLPYMEDFIVAFSAQKIFLGYRKTYRELLYKEDFLEAFSTRMAFSTLFYIENPLLYIEDYHVFFFFFEVFSIQGCLSQDICTKKAFLRPYPYKINPPGNLWDKKTLGRTFVFKDDLYRKTAKGSLLMIFWRSLWRSSPNRMKSEGLLSTNFWNSSLPCRCLLSIKDLEVFSA